MFSPTSPIANGGVQPKSQDPASRTSSQHRHPSQETFHTNWEDILAMMDRRSESLRSAGDHSTPKVPHTKGSLMMSSTSRGHMGAGVVTGRRRKKSTAGHDFTSSTGLPPSAFAPVSDDEVSVADDYEGYSEYQGSSRLSTNKTTREFVQPLSPGSDKPISIGHKVHSNLSNASSRIAHLKQQEQQLQQQKQISKPRQKTRQVSEPVKTSKSFKKRNPSNDRTRNQSSHKSDVETGKIMISNSNNQNLSENAHFSSHSQKLSMPETDFMLTNDARTKSDPKIFQTEENVGNEPTSTPRKFNQASRFNETDARTPTAVLATAMTSEMQLPMTSRNDSTIHRVKRIKRTKNGSANNDIEPKSGESLDQIRREENEIQQVLREVEATIMSISPDEKPRTISPHPKSPNFTQADIRSPKLSGFRPVESSNKSPIWKSSPIIQSQILTDRYEPLSVNSVYDASLPTSRKISETGASEFSTRSYLDNPESDLIKVDISKPTVRLFAKLNQDQQPKRNSKVLTAQDAFSRSLDFTTAEDLNRMMYLRKQFYDHQFNYDSGTSTMNSSVAPISAAESNFSYNYPEMSSSRSSSIWSKYDDIEDRNVAIYSQVLRKYGGIMDMESPRVSHIERNKMDPTRRISGTKSYALDHAKRVLVKLKQATGKDFELLHEKEIEDELLSGVEAPKKLPPLGINDPIEIEVRSFYKPRTVKDFRNLPKVQNLAIGPQYTDEEKREKVKKVEKLKQLDQMIRERNRNMLSNNNKRDNKSTPPSNDATTPATKCQIRAATN